jgi:hypothetical protein
MNFFAKINYHGPKPDKSVIHYKGLRRCWEWTGKTNHSGYGRFMVKTPSKRFTARAHRIAWALTHGDIPDGVLVCHKCDNPKCVNPGHLFLGDHIANQRDKMDKGRAKWSPNGRREWPKGQETPTAKLTDEDVRAILMALERGGISGSELARIYGVTRSAISLIRQGKTWTHLRPLKEACQSD